jgi:tetratricopeptide (TPR) repeat protein
MEKTKTEQIFWKNKKFVTIAGVVIVIVILIVFAFIKKSSFMGKFVSQKSADNKQNGANTLIDQYKSSLPNLAEKSKSNNAQDLQNYAVAQYATGDVAGAETTYKKQIEVDKNNAIAHNNLANAYRDQGNYEDAIKEYKAAISISPQTTTSYINLGNMYQYSLGKTDQAMEVYKEAIDQNKDSVDLYVLLAGTYEASSDKDNAKKYFQKALEIQPENQAAKVGLERIK